MCMKQIIVMMAVVVLVGCGKKVDATEQFELGMMYYKGGLVAKDSKKAVEFFQHKIKICWRKTCLGTYKWRGRNKDSKKAAEFSG